MSSSEIVHGDTANLKSSQARLLQRLGQRQVPPGSVVSAVLDRDLLDLSHQLNRQLGLFIDRRGRVQRVILGDAHSLALPEFTRVRGQGGRLRGIRLVLTHLVADPPTPEELHLIAEEEALAADAVADDEQAEALVGQVIAERYTCLALQSKSSLGPLYAAKANDGTDPLFASLFRNLRAIDRLNARDPKGAITVLDTPLPPVREAASALAALARGEIDRQTSQRLALDDAAMSRFGGSAGQLSEVERASLLDAQAHYLRGVARRIQGDDAGTRTELARAVAGFGSVRGGNVVSMRWLLAGANTGKTLVIVA